MAPDRIPEFEVQGLGFRTLGLGFWTLGLGFRTLGDSGVWVLGFRVRTWAQDSKGLRVRGLSGSRDLP